MKTVLVPNILHIDDDADNHEIFYDALKEISDKAHYQATTDAEEALTRLKEKKVTPDVIFLDLNMPRMNGQEFLREVRKYDELSNIPVVVLTSATLPEIVESTKRLGAKRYIEKPNNFNSFIKTISSVLTELSLTSICA